MQIAITLIHIIACVTIIFVILLQTSKGSSIGSAFGGASQTLFGSTGAATFLSKVTTSVAVVFMLTSLGLSILSSSRPTESLMNEVETPAAVQEEQVPAAPPAEGTQPVSPISQGGADQQAQPAQAAAVAPAPTESAAPAEAPAPAGQGQNQ